MPAKKSPDRCAYAPGTPHDVRCVGGALFTVHDARGCVLVCYAHAKWRMTTSSIPGHAPGCQHHHTNTGG